MAGAEDFTTASTRRQAGSGSENGGPRHVAAGRHPNQKSRAVLFGQGGPCSQMLGKALEKMDFWQKVGLSHLSCLLLRSLTTYDFQSRVYRQAIERLWRNIHVGAFILRRRNALHGPASDAGSLEFKLFMTLYC